MRASLRAAAEAQLRVIKHLPVGDLSLVILKGHLLIEELLYNIVKSKAQYPEAIEQAKLSFYRLAQLAKAFHYEERLKGVWNTIFAINRLRNMVAHNLELSELDKNLRAFARAVAGDNREAEELVVSDPANQIGMSIEVICGVLIAIAFPPAEEGN